MTLSLGQLIRRLEACDQQAQVCFDFCGYVPGSVLSSRGNYAELAIGLVDPDTLLSVSELLRQLRAADGATMSGYKGGDFRMDRSTPIWVDNWGQWTSTAITGVNDDEGYKVVIETRYAP